MAGVEQGEGASKVLTGRVDGGRSDYVKRGSASAEGSSSRLSLERQQQVVHGFHEELFVGGVCLRGSFNHRALDDRPSRRPAESQRDTKVVGRPFIMHTVGPIIVQR